MGCGGLSPGTLSPFGGILLFNGSPDGATYGIGLAIPTASDGGSYKPWANNPVLTVGSGWESSTVKDPHVVKVGSTYYCYYSGYNGTTYKIGLATSTNGFEWTKHGSNPLLSVGSGGSWDDSQVNAPYVIYDPDETDSTRRWKMWYSGSASGAPGKYSIGYAYSSDGISWTKYASNPVVSPGSSGTWEDEGVLFPVVWRTSSSSWTLFYGGRSVTGSPSDYKIGRATFSTPESTYSKGGGNPIISPSSWNQALTSNTTSASATVVVADTSGFVVGEPVLLWDTTQAVMETRIASINSSTQVTITEPAARTWSTGAGSTLRSGFYQSITPRSIIQTSGGTFVLFGTAFQHFSGSPFYERAVSWTASTVGGSFTADVTRGFILPLSQAWDQLSAENPAVVLT